jgi:hypothetical protein
MTGGGKERMMGKVGCGSGVVGLGSMCGSGRREGRGREEGGRLLQRDAEKLGVVPVLL